MTNNIEQNKNLKKAKRLFNVSAILLIIGIVFPIIFTVLEEINEKLYCLIFLATKNCEGAILCAIFVCGLLAFYVGIFTALKFRKIVKQNFIPNSKKYIILLIILIITGIIVQWFAFAMMSFGPKCRFSFAQDAKRQSDIRQIGVAMGLVYMDEGKYPMITTTNGGIDIKNIGNYMPIIPADSGYAKYAEITGGKVSGCNDIPENPYRGFDNTSDRTKFCIYACLTNGKFFAASHKGVKQLDKTPTNLDCWVMLDERVE